MISDAVPALLSCSRHDCNWPFKQPLNSALCWWCGGMMESQVQLNHCLSAKNKFPFGGLKVLNSIQIDLIYILHPFTATFHNVAVIALPSFIIRGYRDLGGDWPWFLFLSKTYSCYCTRGKFHQILYIRCLGRPWERRDWPRPRTNRLRSSLLSVTLLLTSSCKKKKRRFTSEPRAV